jgi:aminoglycoside 6-adenylyltransferase
MTDADAIALTTPLGVDGDVEGVLGRLAEWGRCERRIRAVVLVGSRARVRDHPADEWADSDVLLIANRPRHYLTTTGWLAALGDRWLTYLDETPVGNRTERRAVFAGAVEVDFVVLSILEMRLAVHALETFRRLPRLARLLPARRLHQLDAVSDIVRRGMRVLIDKDGLATRLQRAPTPLIPRRPPAEAVFHETVHHFWHWPIWAAKHLRRGELWRVKAVSEPHRNQALLRMLEWHACVRNGWSYETWDRGRFLEEWADSRAVRALRDLFGRYDREDLWRSLWASMELFRWLGVETAGGLGYRYPRETDQEVTRWVERLGSQEVAAASRAG